MLGVGPHVAFPAVYGGLGQIIRAATSAIYSAPAIGERLDANYIPPTGVTAAPEGTDPVTVTETWTIGGVAASASDTAADGDVVRLVVTGTDSSVPAITETLFSRTFTIAAPFVAPTASYTPAASVVERAAGAVVETLTAAGNPKPTVSISGPETDRLTLAETAPNEWRVTTIGEDFEADDDIDYTISVANSQGTLTETRAIDVTNVVELVAVSAGSIGTVTAGDTSPTDLVAPVYNDQDGSPVAPAGPFYRVNLGARSTSFPTVAATDALAVEWDFANGGEAVTASVSTTVQAAADAVILNDFAFTIDTWREGDNQPPTLTATGGPVTDQNGQELTPEIDYSSNGGGYTAFPDAPVEDESINVRLRYVSGQVTHDAFASNGPLTISAALGAGTGTVGNVVLDGAYTTGTDPTGVNWIVVPSGTAQMSDPGTEIDTGGGVVAGGTQINPQRLATGAGFGLNQSTDDQGYDERGDNTYVDALRQAAWPATVQAGDTIVIQHPRPDAPASSRDGFTDHWEVCHILDAVPGPNVILGSPIKWVGQASVQHHTIDVSARLAELPTLDPAGVTAPTAAQITAALTRADLHCPVHIQCSAASGNGRYEALWPRNWGMNAGNPSTNYGRNLKEVMSVMWWIILFDNNQADREKCYLWLLRHGIDWGDTVLGSGIWLDTNGGHFQAEFVPCLLSLRETGRLNDIPNLRARLFGNVFGQINKITEAIFVLLAPHDSADLPYCFRRRTLGAGAISGSTIIIPTNQAAGDISQMSFRNMVLVRESDGETAIVNSQSIPDGTGSDTNITASNHPIHVVIDAQPSPAFADGDEIYFEPRGYPVVGEADWNIGNWTVGSEFNSFNPSARAVYRDTNDFTLDAVIIALFDLQLHPTLKPIVSYVHRVNAANTPVDDDLEPHNYFGWIFSAYNVRYAGIFERPVVSAVLGQSENNIGAYNEESAYQFLFPPLQAGVNVQVALGRDSAQGGAAIIRTVDQATIDAGFLSGGTVAFANVWHLGSGGRAHRSADINISGTSAQERLDDQDPDANAVFAYDQEVVAMAEAAWGPIRHANINHFNSEAAQAKNLWDLRSGHYLGLNPDYTPYVFDDSGVLGDIEHSWIDLSGQGRGLLRPDTVLSFMQPGPRILTALDDINPENINYRYDSTGAKGTGLNGMIEQNAEPAAAMRQDFLDRTAALNRGILTTHVGVCLFGDYDGGSQVVDTPRQTSIHPAMRDAEGQILYAGHLAAHELIVHGYLRAPKILTHRVHPNGLWIEFDILQASDAATMRTIRSHRSQAVPAVIRPHYQPGGMGLTLMRDGDTVNSERPIFRLDASSYPAAYRGTVSITETGLFDKGRRIARARFTPEVPLTNNDRVRYGTDGGFPHSILNGFEDYDQHFYKDAWISHVPALDYDTTYGYPGVPIQQEYEAVVSGVTAAPAGDLTAPTTTVTSLDETGTDSGQLVAQLDEPGTMQVVVNTTGATPSAAQMDAGDTVTFAAADTDVTFDITSLPASTQHFVYGRAQDDEATPNVAAIALLGTFTTDAAAGTLVARRAAGDDVYLTRPVMPQNYAALTVEVVAAIPPSQSSSLELFEIQSTTFRMRIDDRDTTDIGRLTAEHLDGSKIIVDLDTSTDVFAPNTVTSFMASVRQDNGGPNDADGADARWIIDGVVNSAVTGARDPVVGNRFFDTDTRSIELLRDTEAVDFAEFSIWSEYTSNGTPSPGALLYRITAAEIQDHVMNGTPLPSGFVLAGADSFTFVTI